MTRLLVLLFPIALAFSALAFFAAGSTAPATGSPRKAPCRVEGTIIGYLPAVVVSPCRGGVRSGGALHRRDRVTTSAIGEVTFSTQHVLRCTLRNGSAVIRPVAFVVLELKRGSIFCKQRPGRPRWKFKGPNVTVKIAQPTASKTLTGGATPTADGEVIFGIVASKQQSVVKVAEGMVRASARGATRVVAADSQVTVKRRHRPSEPHAFNPTPTESQTIDSLRNDVATTTPTDLTNVFETQKQKSGVLIAENPTIVSQVAKRLSNVKMFTLSRDEFWRDSKTAALRIGRFGARIVVVAGTFKAMSTVLTELNDADFQRITARKLTVVFVPIRSDLIVLTFDDLPTGLFGTGDYIPVRRQYADRGVLFNGPFAIDYARGISVPSFAHSGTNAIEQCVGREFCSPIFTFTFTEPHKRVEVWVGFSTSLRVPATVVLGGLDASGKEITRNTVPFAPTELPVAIRTRLGVATSTPAIMRARLTVSPATATQSLAADDLGFDRRSEPTGGAGAVTASRVSLSPTRPKAGLPFAATVRVFAGGVPVNPTRVTCAGTVGGTRVAGRPRAATGRATCVFRARHRARGKTLRGRIAFRAEGTSVTRRFSVRLR